jgi:hypothetical protein
MLFISRMRWSSPATVGPIIAMEDRERLQLCSKLTSFPEDRRKLSDIVNMSTEFRKTVTFACLFVPPESGLPLRVLSP